MTIRETSMIVYSIASVVAFFLINSILQRSRAYPAVEFVFSRDAQVHALPRQPFIAPNLLHRHFF